MGSPLPPSSSSPPPPPHALCERGHASLACGALTPARPPARPQLLERAFRLLREGGGGEGAAPPSLRGAMPPLQARPTHPGAATFVDILVCHTHSRACKVSPLLPQARLHSLFSFSGK